MIFSEWKEIEPIQEGDIVFFINGLLSSFVYIVDCFFSNTTDIETQLANLNHVLNCDKRFHLGLISRQKFMYLRIL